MPLLATFLGSILSSIFGFLAAVTGAKIAVRLVAVATIGALYVASVLAFSNIIAPWLSGVFSSQYGQLLGLLFPPVAGTVLSALAGYWGTVAAFRYVQSLTKMAVG